MDQFLTSQDQLVEEVHLVLVLAEPLTDSVGSQQTMKDRPVLQGLDFIKFSLPVNLELLLPIDCLNLQGLVSLDPLQQRPSSRQLAVLILLFERH